MARRIDPRIHNSFVDANFWDISGASLEDAAVSEIMKLYHREDIILIMPHSVKAEIDHPNTPPKIKRQAADLLFTEPTNLTPNEWAMHAKILKMIQGDAKPGRHDRDIMHLFEAEKYGGGYFITKDIRVLKKAREVERMLTSLRVVQPSEFMQYYRSRGL